MFERCKQQRFPLEVSNRLFVQGRIEMRFDHLLHRARGVAQVSILGQVDGAHAAAANAAHNLVAGV